MATVEHRRPEEKLIGGRHRHEHGSVVRSPFRLMSWLRLHGLDIVTMAVFGAIALGVYYAGPAPSRSFPIYNLDGSLIYPEYAYPHRKQIIPIWASALMSFFIPFVFITLFQIRRRSVDDWLTTNFGVLKSLITAAVFQVFIKWLIGGLRPHFYAICQPSVSPGAPNGAGFANLMFDRSICTGNSKDVDDALESMPSGHATAAFAGLIFLALYFNAQLKVMSAHNPAYWKMIMFFAPILGAVLIAGSLTIDKYHHWYDVLVGALIGTATAFVAFRQTFASVWDFRFNHILLPRATSLFHRSAHLPGGRGWPYYTYEPVTGDYTSHDLPFTREGGWEFGMEQNVGAPSDAAGLGNQGGMMGLGASAVNATTNPMSGSVTDGYTSGRDGVGASTSHPQRVSTSTADYGKPPITHTAGMV